MWCASEYYVQKHNMMMRIYCGRAVPARQPQTLGEHLCVASIVSSLTCHRGAEWQRK